MLIGKRTVAEKTLLIGKRTVAEKTLLLGKDHGREKPCYWERIVAEKTFV